MKDGLTVLVGPNNEGKSNVLRALVLSLKIASQLNEVTLGRRGRLSAFALEVFAYDWNVDFPVALQAAKPEGESEFDLDFELTEQETKDFKREVKSSLNGLLPIRIKIGKGPPSFSVRKQGPGGTTLSSREAEIAAFIGKRIGCEHIPAVRPAESATSVVAHLLEREWRALASNSAYLSALKSIEELEKPILDSISRSVTETLQEFLPNVRSVQVTTPRDARIRAIGRSCEVIVDDGAATSLTRKGDGVQSLAALSLMRHASQSNAGTRQLILAIEEPESHLHASAIHQLREVLLDVAKQHQVIITTHCPIFVDRLEASASILVTSNRARSATSIAEIREAIGVRVSDNLIAAEVVLVVEGENDRKAMKALLAHYSPVLSEALRSGKLCIETLEGGSKLPYKLSLLQQSMCRILCLLDHDSAGLLAGKAAISHGLIQSKDVVYTMCPGMAESEMEDWIDHNLYMTDLCRDLAIPPSSTELTSTKGKWSDRMNRASASTGRPWDHGRELHAKWIVSSAVERNPSIALHSARRGPFDALVNELHEKLK